MQVDEKTIKKQYREKFHQLSDRKKLPYIEMALEAEPQYQACILPKYIMENFVQYRIAKFYAILPMC